jgi:hypothetical protein
MPRHPSSTKNHLIHHLIDPGSCRTCRLSGTGPFPVFLESGKGIARYLIKKKADVK